MKVVVLVIEAVTCRFCFFFRQKTAYERRISDWSSDVCSSDLRRGRLPGERERAFGAVDRDHFGGAGQCRLHGKAPGEGVAVEHARVPGERRRPGAVVALVVEPAGLLAALQRSEEHTSELQSLMRISYAVFCLKKKLKDNNSRQMT